MDCSKSVTISPGASSVKRNRSMKPVKLGLELNKLKEKPDSEVNMLGKRLNWEKRSGNKFSPLKKHKASCDEMKDIKKNESSDLESSTECRSEIQTNLNSPLQKVTNSKIILSPKLVSAVINLPRSHDPSRENNDIVENKFKDINCLKLDDNFVSKTYIMWENNSNLCWLDASMALIVHTQTLRKVIDFNGTSQIVKIFKSYYEANYVINDCNLTKRLEARLKIAKEKLKTVQESTLLYLQPMMKFKDGEPDSAFCSLYNLIAKDKNVRSHFEAEFAFIKDCKKCRVRKTVNNKKPIITLSKVKCFVPSSPISVCHCSSCKAPDQEMVLIYKSLPPCLIFHFENGAGTGDFQCLDFALQVRKYELTGLMTMEKIPDSTINHFITWIRDPATNKWLECNDLKTDLLTFSVEQPDIKLQNVYIIIFEAADELGTIANSLALLKSVLTDEDALQKNSDDVPLIDLSEEDADSKSSSIKTEISAVDNKNNSVETKTASLLSQETNFSIGEKNQVAMSIECNVDKKTEVPLQLIQNSHISELGSEIDKPVKQLSCLKMQEIAKLSGHKLNKTEISENGEKCSSADITSLKSGNRAPVKPGNATSLKSGTEVCVSENVEISETLTQKYPVKRKLYVNDEKCVKKLIRNGMEVNLSESNINAAVNVKDTLSETYSFQISRYEANSLNKCNPNQSKVVSDASKIEDKDIPVRLSVLETNMEYILKMCDQNKLQTIPMIMEKKSSAAVQRCEQETKLDNLPHEHGLKNNIEKTRAQLAELKAYINYLESKCGKVGREIESPQSFKASKNENSFEKKEQTFMETVKQSESKLTKQLTEPPKNSIALNKCAETSIVPRDLAQVKSACIDSLIDEGKSGSSACTSQVTMSKKEAQIVSESKFDERKNNPRALYDNVHEKIKTHEVIDGIGDFFIYQIHAYFKS